MTESRIAVKVIFFSLYKFVDNVTAWVYNSNIKLIKCIPTRL